MFNLTVALIKIIAYQWPVLLPCYDRSYTRNPNKLDHFDSEIFFNFECNDLAYLDYAGSYDYNTVIALATADH